MKIQALALGKQSKISMLNPRRLKQLMTCSNRYSTTAVVQLPGALLAHCIFFLKPFLRVTSLPARTPSHLALSNV